MRILYVEDDPLDTDLTVRWLKRNAPHFAVDTVRTTADALERLTAGDEPAFDMVLTDLHLPDADGLSLLHEIRRRSLPVAVTVITGGGSEEAAVKALKAGADDYIVKGGTYLEHLPITLENAFHRHMADAARQAAPLRALYAEHDAIDIELTTRHFAQHVRHIQLDVVTDGAAALARLASDQGARYDVCLLDYHMPGLDGLEVLKHVRHELRAQVPIVLVTGQGDDEVMLQALRLGASGYVIKNPGYLHRLPAELENAHYRARLETDEAALRESREQLARAEAFAHVISVHVGLDGRFLKVQPTLAGLLGYDEAAILAGSFTDLLHDGDQPVWSTWLELLNSETRSRSAEIRLVRRDGGVVWCFANCSVVPDSVGRPVYFLVYLTDISQRREAEVALRNNEARTRAILSAVPDLLFVQTDAGVFIDYHARDPDDLLLPPEAFLGRSVRDVLPPDVAAAMMECFERLRETSEPQSHEYELTIRGELRHFEARLVQAEAGTVVSIIREITEWKRAEAALSRSRDRVRLLAGRLIAAQEEERVRIANELHDDLSQGIAGMTIGLSHLRQQLSDAGGSTYEAVAALERQAVALADRTRAISRQLHSAVLDNIGLPAALKSFCQDFSMIAVHLEVEALPEPLAQSVQLCLYRVVQESLHNAGRHSRAEEAVVRLTQTDGVTELTVCDAGVGFDPRHARSKGGLGLISLEERVRLAGGTIQFDAEPGKGTEVRVRIPAASH